MEQLGTRRYWPAAVTLGRQAMMKHTFLGLAYAGGLPQEGEQGNV